MRDIKPRGIASNMSHALENFWLTSDQFVAGGERNGPWTRGLPTRSAFEPKMVRERCLKSTARVTDSG